MKSILKYSVLTSLLYFVSYNAVGQSKEQIQKNLAEEFFFNKEYEKSIDIYEDLIRKNDDKEIYLPLVNAYLKTERFDEAEKLAKKQLKKYPRDPVYQVDYGYILKVNGEEKKGEKVYDEAIESLVPNTRVVLDLSSSFQRRNELEFAIECLRQGKKLTGKFYGYEFELAELYFQIGDTEAMLEEYMDLIQQNEAYLQNVQNALNTSIYNDPKQEQLDQLNKALLKRIQRNPDKAVFAELLIWHYLQQKDFENAIVQAKALDKRLDENGRRFVPLAASCRSNRKFDLAMDCYQYLIDKGPSSSNYITARILMTETIREKITSGPYTDEDILTMEDNYIKTLDDIGSNGATVSLQIGLAEVWSFYMTKSDTAVKMLEYALEYYPLVSKDAAKCKMILADIYLSVDEIWEASLLYSQIEKDFKFEPIGDEAKFKNSKIYFYTGDFLWAKAQLDILKGSTSKLIANDAMRLSLLISDNMAFDSTGEALQTYGQASLHFEQQQYKQAMEVLQSMEKTYVLHNILDEVLFLEYEILMKEQKFSEAAEKLTSIYNDHGDGILGDEALFHLAEIHDYFLNDEQKAQDLYKELIAEYPSSIRVVQARKRYRQIRGDEIN